MSPKRIKHEPRRRSRRGAQAPLPLAERLPQFIGGPADAVDRLARLRVGCIGAGSVGGRIAKGLAHCGVGGLVIVDPSTIEPANRVTYDIDHSAVGELKAAWVAAECRAIHPRCDVEAWVQPLAAVPTGVWAGVDVLVYAADNLPCEVQAGDTAVQLGLPLFLASVDGPTLSAQIRSFGNDSPDGPCPACSYNAHEWRLYDQATRFSCAGGGATIADAAPTMSTAFLCSTAADFAVNQIVRHWLGLGRPVVDMLLAWSGYTHVTLSSPLARNPNCRRPHTTRRSIAIDAPLSTCTWQHLQVQAEQAVGSRVVTLEVEGYGFVGGLACDCGATTDVDRFGPFAAAPTARCVACDRPLTATPFDVRRAAPIDRLPSSARPADAGAEDVRGIIVNFADCDALLFQRPAPRAEATT